MTAAPWNPSPPDGFTPEPAVRPVRGRPGPTVTPISLDAPTDPHMTDDELGAAFTRFANRRLAAHLRAQPTGWPGSDAAWERLRSIALTGADAELASAFIAQLAAGWTARELASGQPDPGTERLASGAPRRPLAMGTDYATASMAAELLRGLAEIPATSPHALAGVPIVDLEAAARGQFGRGPETLAAAMAAARGAIAGNRADRAADAAARAAVTTISCFREFRAAGISFEPRTLYVLDPGQFDEVQERAAREPEGAPPLFEIVPNGTRPNGR